MRTFNIVFILAVIMAVLTGCSTDAQVASHNLAIQAEQFNIDRQIVFYNSITDTVMLEVTGRCSIFVDTVDDQLEVTCKDSDTTFKKSFLGRSDNVTYFVQDLGASQVDVYRYTYIIKPENLLPGFEVVID